MSNSEESSGGLWTERVAGQRPPLENAYFLAMTVADVRCFGPEQTLSLTREDGTPARWTFILAPNGTGKTTLLQMLALGVPAWSQHTKTVFPRFYTSFPDAVGRHESIRIGRSKMDVSYRICWGEALETAPTGQRSDLYKCSAGDDSTYSADGPYRRAESLVYAYGAHRVQGPPGMTADSFSDPTRTLFDDHATLRNPEEWLLQTDLVASKASEASERAKNQFERVREILKNVLPDLTDIRVDTTTNPHRPTRAIVEVLGPDGWVPFSSLGLGYRTMTAWMVDFASRLFERYTDLPNPLAGAAVCIVDEIDLHLHPKWQRELIGKLTELFPETQFIATAHSPLVIQAAKDANLVVLRREGDHVVIDDHPHSVRNWRLDQILTSDLFGLPSARVPELDAVMQERDAILAKPKLTKADTKRLAELRDALGDLPHGDTKLDIEAMDIIRRAAVSIGEKS